MMEIESFHIIPEGESHMHNKSVFWDECNGLECVCDCDYLMEVSSKTNSIYVHHKPFGDDGVIKEAYRILTKSKDGE